MTPRIPRGWQRATERGEGVQLWHSNGGRYFPSGDHVWSGMLISSPWTYIRRVDPAVPADPNHALRLEDEAARSWLPQIPVSERPDDAEPMVPGMMRLTSGVHLPVASLTWGRARDGSGTWVAPAEWEHEWVPLHDDRTPAEFAAAYTAARDHTIRHDERIRAEIAADDAERERRQRIAGEMPELRRRHARAAVDGGRDDG